MMGHYTTRAYTASLAGGRIMTFQSIAVWYGESPHVCGFPSGNGIPVARGHASLESTDTDRRPHRFPSRPSTTEKCADRELNPGYELGKLMSYH